MRLKPFKNSDCYVTDEVSSIPVALANLCQYTREKFVTDLAAVSRGKDSSKNPSVRFQALLKEAAPNEVDHLGNALPCSSRPMEFLPVVLEVVEYMNNDGEILHCIVDPYNRKENYDEELDLHVLSNMAMSSQKFLNEIVRFSYVDYVCSNTYFIHTNLRALYNAGIPYEDIPFIDILWYKLHKNENGNFIQTRGEMVPVSEIGDPVHEGLGRYAEGSNCIGLRPDKMLENGYTVEDIIQDYKDGNFFVRNSYEEFKAIKLQLPMLVWAQWPMTHTQLSKESQSDRVAEGNGYWLPDDIIEKINDVDDEDTQSLESAELVEEFESLQLITKSPDLSDESKISAIKDCFLKVLPQNRVQRFLELCGYKREIWSRAPYYFKLKEVVVTGWYNDPTTWKHSFLERSVEPELWKNWTQKETKQVMECVKKVIEGKEEK